MVDSEQLWRHVERLAAEPRPAGSRVLESCRGYVTEQLEARLPGRTPSLRGR
ncbi:MAG: hypothetical protein CM1200mP2_12870 [Planctomycetaceae bacterium]|nr:MAG: hypothetical protein CM1200mP2_12870 [Planctomycetaceae bacterium]